MIWPEVQKPHWNASCSMKGALHRVQPVVAGESLDGRDVVVRVRRRKRKARQRPAPVHQYGTSAALAAVATLLRAGQPARSRSKVEQRGPPVRPGRSPRGR